MPSTLSEQDAEPRSAQVSRPRRNRRPKVSRSGKTLEDVDNDGDLDLVLHFRIEDTLLDAVYAQLLQEDLDGDGVLDSSGQEAEVSLAAALEDGTLIEGSDSLELKLRGAALRELLDELFG